MNANKKSSMTVILIFGLLISATWSGCQLNRVDAETSAGDEKKVPVHVTHAERRTFEERITAQGNLAAKNAVMIPPLIDGTVIDFFVDEGDMVEAGKTPLFQTDKIKLEQAVAIAERDLLMAQAGLREAVAQQASVQAQYDKAEQDLERYTRLFEQRAITPDTMEKVQTGYKVAEAGLERAQVGLAVAEERVKQAESALTISRKILSDSLQYAPITGVVSMRMKEQGEFAPAGAPIIRIVDPTLLELSVFLPGEYYPRIIPGETQLHIIANTVDVGTVPVSYKSPEIQPTLRTFEVKCDIANPPTGVVPGSMANVSTILTVREGVGVPTKAIQKRGRKEIVFTVENDRARMVEITRGIETDGWTEITNGLVTEGMMVITMGQFLVDEGTVLSIREEGS